MGSDESSIITGEDKAPLQEVIPTVKPSSSKHFLFVCAYMSVVPVFLVVLILFSLFLRQGSPTANKYGLAFNTTNPKYQAVPEENESSLVTVETADARVESLEEFFKKYDSPLKGHGQLIVDEADKHNLDYKLLPAIAMKESTLCKKTPKNSYNCWGFGIYGKKVTRFESYEEAIKTVTETLSKKYIQLGYEEPEEIMKKYTPSSDGSWADGVNFVMDKLHSSL